MTNLELAQRFHDIYVELAPSFGYEIRTRTRIFDPESKNGKLMIANCSKIMEELDNYYFSLYGLNPNYS